MPRGFPAFSVQRLYQHFLTEDMTYQVNLLEVVAVSSGIANCFFEFELQSFSVVPPGVCKMLHQLELLIPAPPRALPNRADGLLWMGSSGRPRVS